MWGSGDTLLWQIQDTPDWSPHFGNVEEVASLVRTALGVWSDIPTADIQWRVQSIATERSRARDGVNGVYVGVDEPERAFANRWSQRPNEDADWETVECDITFGQTRLERIADTDRPNHLSTVLHELGHCLGLRHAAVSPTPTPRWDWDWTGSSIWEKDPAMSYGWDVDNRLAEDDVIGASLSRPVSGWRTTTGSITGSLRLDNGPAAFVSVHILRNSGGNALAAVQVFSDEGGGFLVEGLMPGEYLLWIHPIIRHGAHTQLLEGGDLLSDVRDTLDTRIVSVLAGQVAEAGELTLRRGRSPG